MKGLQFLVIGISVLLLSFILSPTEEAHADATYRVGTSSLNVRIAPSHDAEILGQLNPGDHVVVCKEQYGWAQTYYGGKVAWMAKKLDTNCKTI